MKVKVKNAKALPHHKHNLTHDVSTSYDFGHMQPLMVRELPAGSKSTLRVGQIVRLMDMVLPTFGNLSLNTYNVFVPIESIFHPYASLRSGQTYMGANATYIPQQVLTCMPLFWNAVCKSLSRLTFLVVPTSAITYNERSFGVDLTQAQLLDTTISNVWQRLYGGFLTEPNNNIFTDAYLFQYTTYGYSSLSSVPTSLSKYDWIDLIPSSNNIMIVCGQYHEAAKNLRKVLYGCGYKLIDDSDEVSLLPILAYYKAWFDLFAPQRDITWKDTAAAGIQEWCEQNGKFFFDSDNGILFQKPDLVFRFIEDLCSTYYTQSPDFVSAHITGQRISTVTDNNFQSMDALGSVRSVVKTAPGSDTGVGVGVYVSSSTSPVPSSITSNLLNASNIDILMRLTHRINASTVIGGKIREFLKTQLGSDYLDEDESYWIGSQKLDINITPVFSNAQTGEGNLGEFAGQGSGGTSGETFKYENKVDGFWVCMAAIVPDSRFAQGMDMNLKHVRRNDFFDPSFDSVTLLPTPKKYIFADVNFSNRIVTSDDNFQQLSDLKFNESFGNIPNYIEYCVAQNLQNGDMSLRSKRDSYLPFTLDKLLPYTDEYTLNGREIITNTSMDIIVNSTIWRYIGLYKWIGNYNRIFQNSNVVSADVESRQNQYNNMFYAVGPDDNFIGHNTLFFEVWNSKLPVNTSFNTGAFDEGAISLDKA